MSRSGTLTPDGEQALHDWLVREDPLPFELRDVGLVKLFFADSLPPDEAGILLEAVRRRSAARITALSAIRAGAEETPGGHPLLTLRMGIAFHQAIIDVCNTFAKESLRHMPPSVARK